GFLKPVHPNLGAIGIGLDGIKKKDTLTMMFRVDKNLDFQGLLGTNRPSLSSIQFFDTMVLDFKEDEGLTRLFAYGAPLKKHSAILTAFTLLNYKSDTINPSLAIGTDLNNGGGFVIPAVDFVLGDSWRLKAEADLFWANKKSTQLFDGNNPGTQLFGYFANNSQLVFRLTRQF
ncbi:MAG TPA: LysR family transcriptional regulator, partial [Rhodocyclaceae bacterium]